MLGEHANLVKVAFKGDNVGNSAILQISNVIIEFVCLDIELNSFKYG